MVITVIVIVMIIIMITIMAILIANIRISIIVTCLFVLVNHSFENFFYCYKEGIILGVYL